MHAVMSRAFQHISWSSYCSKDMKEKGDFLERLNFGPISTPCILGTVTDRQNHLHITFRDINEKYKEESIHQHCMKNEHPHRPLCMHAVMSRAFQHISWSSYCSKDMKFQKGPNETSEFLKFYFIY
jgi:hypothetical protein